MNSGKFLPGVLKSKLPVGSRAELMHLAIDTGVLRVGREWEGRQVPCGGEFIR
ncbi:hypothetical protein D3C81_2103750 [compost metagenome]